MCVCSSANGTLFFYAGFLFLSCFSLFVFSFTYFFSFLFVCSEKKIKTTGVRVPALDTFSYSTSKAAVHHLTKVLANKLAPKNITVNAIAAGALLLLLSLLLLIILLSLLLLLPDVMLSSFQLLCCRRRCRLLLVVVVGCCCRLSVIVVVAVFFFLVHNVFLPLFRWF